MNRNAFWFTPAVIFGSAIAGYATTYLSVEQAQEAIFPGATFVAVDVKMNDTQRKAVEKASGIRVRKAEQRVWRVVGGGWFIVDEVVGKHEFISYAVGLNTDGSVKQIEIMDYRETYGYQIRNETWRRQFVGKTCKSELRLDEDIKNISGATLSCRHITDGVKRILFFYELFLKS